MQWNEITLTREDQYSLYCRTIGDGEPLLLIHGAACDSEFFVDTAPLLARHYHVILYDRSGYGHSKQEEEPVARNSKEYFSNQGDDAAWVLRQLAPGQKAVVIGCSCGAVVASYLTARHPGQIERVLLHDPPVYSLVPENKECWQLIDGIHEAASKGKYFRALNRFLLLLGPNSDPCKSPMTDAELDSFMANGLEFIRRELKFAFDSEFSLPQMPPGISLTVLLGADSSGIALAECASRVAEALNCPLHIIPGGHNAARESPGLFAQAVLNLLQGE